MDEKIILEGLKNREEPVLRHLQQTYTAYLCQVARRIIGAVMTEEDIEEVVGEAFFQLWSHAGELDLKKGSLKAYLTAIVRNGAKNKLRKCRLMEEPLQELEEDLGLSVIPEDLEDLAAEELWFTYYDTSRDKEAIIDMKLNVSGQEEPVYLEINMVLETKEEQDGEYGEAFADIGIVMSEISSRENERKTEDGKPYLTISSHRPHYQLIGEDTEDDSEEAVLIYHQAQKMLTPGYEHEALFFLNGMRYYLYGIETEEITEDLADAFLKTR